VVRVQRLDHKLGCALAALGYWSSPLISSVRLGVPGCATSVCTAHAAFAADGSLHWRVRAPDSARVLQIFDARTMAWPPIATVKLSVRVPSGFHGLWVPQSELDTQDTTLKAPDWDAPYATLRRRRARGAWGWLAGAFGLGNGKGEGGEVVPEAPEDMAKRQAVLWGSA
jgi:Retinal pigment epithelial membrane protein